MEKGVQWVTELYKVIFKTNGGVWLFLNEHQEIEIKEKIYE